MRLKEIEISDGKKIRVRPAETGDMEKIQSLYNIVYGGKYTLSEINDSERMRAVIEDPWHLWLLAECEEKIAGSVIFLIDSENLIGKTMAGVVLPNFRGNKLLSRMIAIGVNSLMKENHVCELIYGVVRTFITLSLHQELNELGFVDMGIFPNVRKVRRYETHGLKVNFTREALDKRKKEPVLIPQADEIYQILRSKLNLEPAKVEDIRFPSRIIMDDFPELKVEDSRRVEEEYLKLQKEGRLILNFFPFHHPQIKLHTKDGSTEVFVHFQSRDGHGSILGVKTDEEDLTPLLINVSECCENFGVKYLELLISAYDPVLQKKAYDAGFLPTAYFPAARLDKGGRRIDYVVTSNTFVLPKFKGLKLTEDARPYLRAFIKLFTQKLWEDIVDIDI